MIMCKKKGSLLVEVILTVFILIIIANIIIASIVLSNKSAIKRRYEEECSRIVYSVINEIRYNYTMLEIEGRLQQGRIALQYNEKFLEELLRKPLLDMRPGKDILIDKINEFNNGSTIKFRVKTNILINDELIEREEFFTKSKWMEKIYEEKK